MIIVTGGAGFIGSNIVAKLNEKGINDIIIVDNLGTSEKWQNLRGKHFSDFIHKTIFLDKIENLDGVEAIIHMGACSSTTEKDADYLMENNYRFSKALLHWSLKNNVRFIYASSAATYGSGEFGYSDSDENSMRLKPLNMYGLSKQLFDEYLIMNKLQNKVVGLKFFNVFGHNEYHKGDMRSMVKKAYEQISDVGYVKLFKSYKDGIKDGMQKRDFVYVKDVVDVVLWLLGNDKTGIYNLGSGVASTWIDLMNAVFKAMNLESKIKFVDMPNHLQGKYQYYTKAEMEKLQSIGYEKAFTSLDDAVDDYVNGYLKKMDI